MIEQIFAGAGLGLLVGILVALSASPVVSGVVGAIAAGMLPLLGFAERTGAEKGLPPGSAWRLGSFGVVCAVAVVGGLYIRTNDVLTPPFETQISKLTHAGFSPEAAREWISIKNLGTGLQAGTSSDAGNSARKGTAGPSSTVLFAGPGDDECTTFDSARYQSPREQLGYLQSRGGRFAAFARNVSALDKTGQRAALDSAKHLFCPE